MSDIGDPVGGFDPEERSKATSDRPKDRAQLEILRDLADEQRRDR